MQDTGHVLFDNHGCGSEKREILDEQIKSGERSFREVSEEMWGSLNINFEDGFEVMEKHLEIDPDFQNFHKFCMANNIPFNVISAGLRPILRKVLDTFLGEEESAHIDIVANDAVISKGKAILQSTISSLFACATSETRFVKCMSVLKRWKCLMVLYTLV